MPKISFIVPVYNMERYLNRALSSLQKQTFTDFEVLLVNDGSTDSSEKICAEFAASDPRFKLFNQKNAGVAAARNTALNHASGDYLFFLDPDDWLEPCAARVLMAAAQENNADLVMFGLFNDSYDAEGRLCTSKAEVPDFAGVFKNSPCKRLFCKIATSHLIIIKLFKRSFVESHGCRFKSYPLGEDGVFFAEVYAQDPQTLVVLQQPLYHYTNARSSSLSNSFHPERLTQGFVLSHAARAALQRWQLLNSPQHKKTLDYCVIRDLQMYIKNLSLSHYGLLQCRRLLCGLMKKPELSAAVRHTALKSLHSANDRLKLLLLKLRLYSAVIAAARMNRAR